MGWTDGLSDSDTFLPLFGGLGVLVVFIVICLFTYCDHREIILDGTPMVVVEIGTCHSDKCAVKVRSNNGSKDTELLEKTTGSAVFVGDILMCGFKTCYKD